MERQKLVFYMTRLSSMWAHYLSFLKKFGFDIDKIVLILLFLESDDSINLKASNYTEQITFVKKLSRGYL